MADTIKGDLKRLNLNMLYSLDAILNSRTLTEAGQRVLLTQAAMSIALRKLRGQLHDDIVQYHAGEHRFTPLADALRPQVRQFLWEAHRLFNLSVSFDPATEERSIRIAAPEYLETMFVSKLVRSLRVIAPRVTVHLVRWAAAAPGSVFERAGADLMVVPAPLIDDRMESAYLFDDQIACIAWTDNGVVGDALSSRTYLDHPHAIVEDGDVGAYVSDRRHATLLARRRIVASAGGLSALPLLLIETDLVATTSMWLAQHFASLLPVRVLGSPFGQDDISIHAQWQKHRSGDPLIQWIIGELRRISMILPHRGKNGGSAIGINTIYGKDKR
ncbi:MAG: LysR substrate-binding domain-containing protein [Sphingomonas phyllosphaerae]|uniref:LysR substrate-binding domain-containing protein n=1 Tax=Sphingomonas phyllosphaerae TaxID=257003 RepID=UPI002FF7DC0D